MAALCRWSSSCLCRSAATRGCPRLSSQARGRLGSGASLRARWRLFTLWTRRCRRKLTQLAAQGQAWRRSEWAAFPANTLGGLLLWSRSQIPKVPCCWWGLPRRNAVSSRSVAYPKYTGTIVNESRATHPAWMYRDLEQKRWETPFVNPQANVEKRFANNLQTRILEKDFYEMNH